MELDLYTNYELFEEEYKPLTISRLDIELKKYGYFIDDSDVLITPKTTFEVTVTSSCEQESIQMEPKDVLLLFQTELERFLSNTFDDYYEIITFNLYEFLSYNLNFDFFYVLKTSLNSIEFINKRYSIDDKLIYLILLNTNLFNGRFSYDSGARKETLIEIIDIYRFLKSEKNKITNSNIKEEELQSKNELTIDKEIQILASAVFVGDGDKLNLLIYLSENFTSRAKNFKELTKYNQIYIFLNNPKNAGMFENKEHNIEQQAYKDLIKKVFGFDYENRQIKGLTKKHQKQLETLAHNYYNSKK